MIGGHLMGLSYNKLWKLLIDRGLNKTDLHEITGIGQSTIVKLSKGENVNTEVLARICKALCCKLEEIVEYQEEPKE
jgi:DNA-binding Xre family transcriptional regulator